MLVLGHVALRTREDRAASGRRYGPLVQVKGIRWVGVGTDDVATMRAFATDVLGLRAVAEQEDFVELAMADGSKLELFGPATVEAPWMFTSNPVVAGFVVDDIEAARAELEQAPGVELLGEASIMPDGYAWQPFRAPDGRVYELVADPSAPA
jgi:catechol 2,3-dioxygenase-like lactoylglutathione lyase family enzyme